MKPGRGNDGDVMRNNNVRARRSDEVLEVANRFGEFVRDGCGGSSCRC